MPTPTADEIEAAAANAAAEGVHSASADGRSVTAIDPEKSMNVADRVRAREAVTGTNSNGGPLSPFRGFRAAKFVPPGAA